MSERNSWPWVAGLLAIFAILSVASKLRNCNTFDEAPHLANGASFWLTGDYRMAPEAILLQRWLSLPLVLGNYPFPSLAQPAWWHSNNWEIAEQYLFELGNDADAMVLSGRLMNLVLGLALGLTVFLWSRSLFGTHGGLVSLTAFCFCPTMLAHGTLATPDAGTALFFLLALAGLWSVLQKITAWRLAASLLAVSGLFLCKMSAVLFIPVAILLVVVRLTEASPIRVRVGGKSFSIRRRWRQIGVMVWLIILHVLVAGLAIWILFGLRYEIFRDFESGRDLYTSGAWDEALSEVVLLAGPIAWAQTHRLLPEAYLYAFTNTLRLGRGVNPAFLNGEVGVGWLSFFPYCFLVKTPIPTLLLLILAGVVCVRCWWTARKSSLGNGPSQNASSGPICDGPAPQRHGVSGAGRSPLINHHSSLLYRTAPLSILFAVYWTAAIMSRINIGQRHLLPVYPVVFIWLGACVMRANESSSVSRVRWAGIVASLLLSILALESLLAWPNYLSYFNAGAGSSRHGYRHLVDSSLDWGQDLPDLRDWLDQQRGDSPVYLSYFGTAKPAYYGIHPKMYLPSYPARALPEEPRDLQPGLYCISATMLQPVYRAPHEVWGERGTWLRRAMPPDRRVPNQRQESGGPGRSFATGSVFRVEASFPRLRAIALRSPVCISASP